MGKDRGLNHGTLVHTLTLEAGGLQVDSRARLAAVEGFAVTAV
ncbi:hypothetical protein SDC9_70343 [bioreactor metagenome]|uniref:Uncharacterized protein n=1 Tax=bioreactor metagenome TaxID=1076179 RepID=A0A644Y5N6_9ZZZZ